MVGEHGVSWMLPRLVGSARAADLLFSSRVVLAEEAERMGLINAVLPAEGLMAHTIDYARRMASEISPWSLRTLKRQLAAEQLGSLHDSASADGVWVCAMDTVGTSVKGGEGRHGNAPRPPFSTDAF